MKLAILDLQDAHAAHTRNLVSEHGQREQLTMTAEIRAEWLVLHQARNGAVVHRDGGYFNAGSPVPHHLATVYDQLIRQGLLALGEPSAGGHRRVQITTSGWARYETLLTGPHRAGNGSDL